MLISILIRTSYRPSLFNRCLESIKRQSHKNIRIVVSYDDERALSYIPEDIQKIQVQKDLSKPFFYDEYVNTLKNIVDSGYFFVLDDDEVLASDSCISDICKHLKGQVGLICQFSRNGRLKPSNELIKQKRVVRTKIGMPCLFLHHSVKNIAQLDGTHKAPDFKWIKDVSSKIRLKFVPIVVAFSDRRSYGQCEN